jgi:hypothetical protein
MSAAPKAITHGDTNQAATANRVSRWTFTLKAVTHE